MDIYNRKQRGGKKHRGENWVKSEKQFFKVSMVLCEEGGIISQKW